MTTPPILEPPFDDATLRRLAGEVDKAEAVQIRDAGSEDLLELLIAGYSTPGKVSEGTRDLAPAGLYGWIRVEHLGRLTREMAKEGHAGAATKIEVARSRWALARANPPA